jgi:hypothetical protein
MFKSVDAARDIIHNGTISVHVMDDTARANRVALTNWLDKTLEAYPDPRDMLFQAHLEQRLWSFTNANLLEMYSEAFIVYPLLDERVARFAGALNCFDRISERVVFGAIASMAPEIANIPLFENTWRFDRSPDKRDFLDSDHNFQQGYVARQPQSLDRGVFSKARDTAFRYDVDQTEFPSTQEALARRITEAPSWPMVSEMIAPK